MVSILLGEQRYFEETLPISELKELLDAGSMSTAKGQSERIRGLKWLLAMISKGTDVSRFFPDVIRNIMTPNLELKKLVYMYVLHYADHDEASRSAALLSINAFQRDLSDDHELIRGLALRTLTSIKVDDIQAVQALAVRTCARDVSPYVRKLAANAVIKILLTMSKNNPNREQFEDEVLARLILDASPTVMGSAAGAMLEVCPDRYDLVHQAFDRLLNVLTEIDEWGQTIVLKLLCRYVRYTYTNPVIEDGEEGDDADNMRDGSNGGGVSVSLDTPAATSNSGIYKRKGDFGAAAGDDEEDDDFYTGKSSNKQKWQGVVLAPIVVKSANKRRLPTRTELDSFLNDESSSPAKVAGIVSTTTSSAEMSPSPQMIIEEMPKSSTSDVADNASRQSSYLYRPKLPMHENHKRLLRAALPLLKSRNSAVVMAAASTMWYCGQRSKSAMQRVAQAMIRLVRSPHKEVRYCALRSVLPLVKERSTPFASNLSDFYVNASLDAPFVRKLKLEIMCRLVREKTLPNVLRELETYVTHPNENFAAEAVRTVGRIAVSNKRSVAHDCLLGLSGFITAEGCSKRVLEESIVVARDVLNRLRRPKLDEDEREILQSLLTGFDRHSINLVRARCCLVWLAREFFNLVPNEATDVLRSACSSFPDEEGIEVKLQVISLASACSEQEPLLSQYVFELGQFDTHHDVRDWARCLSKSNASIQTAISSAEPISNASFLNGQIDHHRSTLPADTVETFQIDTLSFMMNRSTAGYLPLPEWATEYRDHLFTAPASISTARNKTSNVTSSSSSSSGSSSSSDGDSESGSSNSEDSEEEEDEQVKMKAAKVKQQIPSNAGSSAPPKSERDRPVPSVQLAPKVKSEVFVPPPLPVAALQPKRPIEFKPLISHVRGQGLQVDYMFSRDPVPEKYSNMTSVLLRIANKLDDRSLTKIRIEESSDVTPLSGAIESLAFGFYREDVKILLSFNGHWRQPVKFVIACEEIGKISAELRAPAGELLTPDHTLSLEDFRRVKKQLGGMNETCAKIPNVKAYDVQARIVEACNFYPYPSAGTGASLLTDNLNFCFAARRMDTMSTKVLLEIAVGLDGMLDITLNCEYALLGQALMDELKTAFAS